ncbi:hypothetical protein BBG03_03300 [Streptococcus dysgalactiae subsp. equisimilis]|uniref:hypothetical protein n=1 Tax=Streptococcus dysgalactiae TaxID=1334 RepID=UPI0008071400|nr:hypothetical protein [Streptococcus dysgalactiae]OBZ00621.1 hypothetical protein BBG03_03300 [Streptococcus dysgalactiae subsp. equisimilis]
MATKVFSKRVDSRLLDNVSEIYASLGTSTQEAFVMFLKKSQEVGGLPFELRKQVDITDFDNDGKYITDERIAMARNRIGSYDEKRAIDFDRSNPEHMKWLFEE